MPALLCSVKWKSPVSWLALPIWKGNCVACCVCTPWSEHKETHQEHVAKPLLQESQSYLAWFLGSYFPYYLRYPGELKAESPNSALLSYSKRSTTRRLTPTLTPPQLSKMFYKSVRITKAWSTLQFSFICYFLKSLI